MAFFNSRDIGSNLHEFKSTALEIKNKWFHTVGNRYKAFNDDIQRRKNTFSTLNGTQRQLLNVDAVNRTIPEWMGKILNNIMIILNNQRAEQIYLNLRSQWSQFETGLNQFRSSQLTLTTFTEYRQQDINISISRINEGCNLIEQQSREFKENVESDLRMLSNITGVVTIYQGTEFEENFRNGLDEIKSMLEKLKNNIDSILKFINEIKKMISKSLKAYLDYIRQKLSEDDLSSATRYLSKVEKMLRTYRSRFLSY